MPRSTGTVVYNNFTKGLITEASLLDSPEGACSETLNCVHNIDGSVTRRLGYEFELNNSTKSIDRTGGVINSYLWRDVSGNGDLSLIVVQIKDHLYFWDASKSNAVSDYPISASIDLNTFSPSGAPSPSTKECQFANGNGKLFVAHPYLDSFAIEFDTNTETFSTTVITLEIRDFEGLDDGLEVAERPLTTYGGLTQEHKYNLLNQGWIDRHLIEWDTGGLFYNNDHGKYEASAGRTDMPSNADVMWSFKNIFDTFDLSTVDRHYRGNSPAPKGHFILNAFTKDRSTPSGVGIPNDSVGYQRASCIAFFAGRLFYSGLDYVGRSSNIYFSQIIESNDQFGKCYQVNDPTSDTMFDLLPSDGGVIKIQEAGTIKRLIPVPGALAVFASNGIWIVTGSTGLGFTANDYTVSKLSSVQTLSASSFVDISGIPMWWNTEGIYQMQGSQSGGSGYQVIPITTTTIQTYYNSIPISQKKTAKGFFNPLEYKVQWVFKNSEPTDLTDTYEYDTILNFDIRTGGFYVWNIPSHTVKVHGITLVENAVTGTQGSAADIVTNALDPVVDNNGNTVQVNTVEGQSAITTIFKYIVSYDNNFTFAESINTACTDWERYDGVGTDYESYFTSLFLTPSKVSDFESNYVLLYSGANSKYYMQGKWDFSSSSNSGRWPNKQLIDNTFSSNYSNLIAKRKVRGRGKSLQIKISSYDNNNFLINGWAIFLSSSQIP